MELKTIVKDCCLQIAKFREFLIQIGQKKQGGVETWKIIRIQRKQTVDSCYQACSHLIAKKPTNTFAGINQQLDNLRFCVDWLLDEIEKCKLLMQNLCFEGNYSEFQFQELCILSKDIEEAKKLQTEIDFHKIKKQLNTPSRSVGIIIAGNLSSFTMARSEKDKRQKFRPQTRISFP